MSPRATSAVTLALALACASCVYARVLYFNVPTLQTRAHFDRRVIAASSHPEPLATLPHEARVSLVHAATGFASFDAMIASGGTRAFLAVHDDTLIYERYFGGATRETVLPGFSITKTYAALLVGVATRDGILGPLSDPITAYVPPLAGRPGYDLVTLDDLLRMTSGLDYREESVEGAAMYYTLDLPGRMYLYDVTRPPGTHYEYGSVNVQLLWDALHRRLADRTVSDYFGRKVWEPLGAESPAEWSLDSATSGVEKFFGGFGATARDHARIGLLYLHGGTLHGREIVSRAWVDASLDPDPVAGVVTTRDGNVRRGRYQWFLTEDGRGYFAKGYRGQYIFVVPERRAVFVRFGDNYGEVDWPRLFVSLADAMP